MASKFICWPCNFCGQGFPTINEVNKHEERFHPKEMDELNKRVSIKENAYVGS